jgi:hypothetical protein
MKAYEFPSQVTADGKLTLPEAVLANLSNQQSVKVIMLVNEETEDQEQTEWSQFAAAQFLAGYSPSDSIYDEV